MRFARWMASPRGRIPRIAFGMALLAIGIYLQNPWGILIAVLAVIPLASGVDNFCLAAPLFGAGMDGRPFVKKT